MEKFIDKEEEKIVNLITFLTLIAIHIYIGQIKFLKIKALNIEFIADSIICKN